MDQRKKYLAALALLLIEEEDELDELTRPKRAKRCWALNTYRRRLYDINTLSIISEPGSHGPLFYRQFTKISENAFVFLADKIRKLVHKEDTLMRTAISVEERLSITLRYLVTGEPVAKLSEIYGIGKSTIGGMAWEVCGALYSELKKDFIRLPQDECAWKKTATDFLEQWNFPNCIGVLDGIDITCKPSKNNVLSWLALTDANYLFTHVEMHFKGSSTLSGVFRDGSLYRKMVHNELHLPNDEPLPNGYSPIPFACVADDSFAFSINVVTPFTSNHLSLSQRIYNYRLSRVKRIVENTFGLVTTRFSILKRHYDLLPSHVMKITGAISVLHNYFMIMERETYAPPGTFDGEDVDGKCILGTWRPYFELSMDKLSNPLQFTTEYAESIRSEYMNYFNSPEGAIPYQYKCA